MMALLESGPKEWDKYELALHDAKNYGGSCEVAEMTGELHRLFDRHRWLCSEEEYQLLRPSMRLSSNLIEVGMPWIANFLPADKIYKPLRKTHKSVADWESSPPDEIPFTDDVNAHSILSAKNDLNEVADFVTWRVNYEMFSDTGFDAKGEPLEWMGVTRLIDSGPSGPGKTWEMTYHEEIMAADQISQDEGKDRRPLVIAIMGEYVNALRENPKDSEQHLRATFMVASTITHEIGHAVFHQDFRSLNPPSLQEPWVGDECSAELGFSFLSWVFSGYHPQAKIRDALDFSFPMYWDPRYDNSMVERPLYRTHYSISIPYVMQVLTQSFWDGLPNLRNSKNPRDFKKVREALKPVTGKDEDGKDKAAVERIPNFTYSHYLQDCEWKDPTFRLIGYTKGDEVKGLTKEEIEYAKARTTNSGDPRPKISRSQKRLYRQMQGFYGGGTHDDDRDDSSEDDLVDIGQAQRDQYAWAHESEGLFAASAAINLDDGILEQDINPPLEESDTPLTRIEVQYLVGDNTIMRGKDGPSSRYGAKRTKRQGPRDGRREVLPQYIDLSDFLHRVTPHEISFWTRRQAHAFCKEMELESFAMLPENVAQLDAQLELHNTEDMGIVQRIVEAKLNQALNMRIFRNDKLAQADMKEASLKYISHWDVADLKEFCEDQGLSTQGGKLAMARRVHAWRESDIIEMEDESRQEAGDQGDNTFLHSERRRVPSKPENWSRKALIDFCKSRQLPEWGNRKALVTRAQRCQKDERRYAEGQTRQQVERRVGQQFRLSPLGFEYFRFQAILGQSTVTALKSALFIVGEFRCDAELKLYFFPDESEHLEDGRPLSSYMQKDWTKLRMKVSDKWRFGPGSSKDKPIDLTKPGKPVIDWGELFKINTPPPPEDPQLKRLREIKEGAKLTVGERFDRVTKRMTALDRLVQHPSSMNVGPPIPRVSGFDMLEETEDLLEEEELRDQGLVILGQPMKSPMERLREKGFSYMAKIADDIENSKGFKGKRPNWIDDNWP